MAAPAMPGRRRAAGDVLAGAAAVLALLALTAGVPAALLAIFGLPIPHARPALALLTHRLSILAVLKILSVVVWLAWLQLICCVVAEIRAAIRNIGMPARVPLAGGIQVVVHRLVTAALLLLSAGTALTPMIAPQQVAGPPAARQPRPTLPLIRRLKPSRRLASSHHGLVGRWPCHARRRSTSSSLRMAASTRASGKSPRTTSVTGAATGRSSS